MGAVIIPESFAADTRKPHYNIFLMHTTISCFGECWIVYLKVSTQCFILETMNDSESLFVSLLKEWFKIGPYTCFFVVQE